MADCAHETWTPTLTVQPHPQGPSTNSAYVQCHLQVQCAACGVPLVFTVAVPASDLLWQDVAQQDGGQTVRLSARVGMDDKELA